MRLFEGRLDPLPKLATIPVFTGGSCGNQPRRGRALGVGVTVLIFDSADVDSKQPVTARNALLDFVVYKLALRSLSWLCFFGEIRGRTNRTAKALSLSRVLVGWVFVSERIQKFVFPAQMGCRAIRKDRYSLPSLDGAVR